MLGRAYTTGASCGIIAGVIQGIHHVALRVADPERSLAFYQGVLGLRETRRLREEDGRLRAIWVGLPGAVLMLEREVKGAGPGAGSGHVLVLAVDDLPAWEARFAAAGIPVLDRTAATLYVGDPDGHRVGVSVFPLGEWAGSREGASGKP
jgi:catechol 2,3-dioxygenase-like lactoylglutathione lyase family enzyme